MSTASRHGAIVGRELVTSDPARAAAFYCDLFGWSLDADTMAEHGFARLLRDADGRLVGSVMGPGEADRPLWLPWFGVDDIDAAVAIARDHGARTLDGPADAPGIGRYAWLQDPAGVHVGFLGPAPGSDQPTLSPAAVFDELVTPNADVAAEFYQAIFGWEPSRMIAGNGQPYILMMRPGGIDGGRPAAGILGDMPGAGTRAWMVYFGVADLDASRARVEELGGQNVSPVITVPGVGRLAWTADPTGALFQILQPEPMAGEA